MAMDMFIKLTANGKALAGEAVDSNKPSHTGEIQVLAWSWGVSNSGSAQSGTGAGSGKCNVQDLSFTKYIEKSSPTLLLSACNGQHFDTAVLVCRKAGTTPLEYLTITMTTVLISSVSTGGSGGEDRLTENVSLNFAQVKVDYIEQTAKGAKGDTPSMNWDIAGNAAPGS